MDDVSAVILAVSPLSAPASGGHSVSVHLSSPLQGVVACRFGAVTTPARFITEEVATCATPELSGDVLFSFVEDDVPISFANGEVETLFTLRGRTHAMRLAPLQGNEGTLVEIDVAGALTGPGRWRCRFGDVDVRGRVVSSNKVACSAPAGSGLRASMSKIAAVILLKLMEPRPSRRARVFGVAAAVAASNFALSKDDMKPSLELVALSWM